jgi:hypothetical protein
MKKVSKMATDPEFGAVAIMASVYNEQGQTVDTYQLDKRQSLAVSARLNVALLMRIVDRWLLLEEQAQNRAPAIAYKRDTAKLLTDMIKATRERDGDEVKNYDYPNGHKFCNRALTGKYAPIDETTLDAYDLILLGKIREKAAVLFAIPMDKDERKKLMDDFVTNYRTKCPRTQIEQAA